MERISTEEFIRSRARMGLSKAEVSQILGYSRYRFSSVIELLPDVQWPGPNQSVGYKEAQAARRGVLTPKLEQACKKANLARRLGARKLTAGCFVGSITDQIEFWGGLVTVEPCTIRRRLNQGMSDLDALFLPPNKIPPKPTKYWSKKQ